MKKFVLLFIVSFAFAVFSLAQNNIVKSLERSVPGQGKVTIHQDSRIAALIGVESVSTAGVDGQKVIKSSGYRIQVYAGNNTRQAKNEAYAVAARIKEYFPDLMVYTSFNPPRWLCLAGDYRSIEEADAMMRRLRATGVFKEVSIVKEQINIPL
ncbi:SPOR domain-containing protein [Bacteroides zoogleoformans]|uniref:SPOR domain-containing protein n=1 Tax=Bacteroides zoogleoformans TaxID=28119 RepID=UPI00248E475E|nr:SPOR domain-containing protein [Bacteroides zoogleoformans]